MLFPMLISQSKGKVVLGDKQITQVTCLSISARAFVRFLIGRRVAGECEDIKGLDFKRAAAVHFDFISSNTQILLD